MRRLLCTLAVLAGAALVAPPLRAAGYTFTTIDYPVAPGSFVSTSVNGINNLGQIVGSFSTAGLSVPTGFVLDSGTFKIINAGLVTIPHGINDLGTVVGYGDSFSDERTAFVYQSGTVTKLQAGNAAFTVLWGINNAGVMVGTFQDPPFLPSVPQANHAFFAFSSDGPFPTIDFPGAISSELTGVNNLGAVTGTFRQPVLLNDFSYISLGGEFFGSGPGLSIYCINDDFAFGGAFVGDDGGMHGFVQAGDVTTLVEVPGAVSTIVYGINNAGTIVGTYVEASGRSHGFMAVPAP
jgi:probable HAF family extracellular repeat protein